MPPTSVGGAVTNLIYENSPSWSPEWRNRPCGFNSSWFVTVTGPGSSAACAAGGPAVADARTTGLMLRICRQGNGNERRRYVHGHTGQEAERPSDRAEILTALLRDGTRYPAGSRDAATPGSLRGWSTRMRPGRILPGGSRG